MLSTSKEDMVMLCLFLLLGCICVVVIGVVIWMIVRRLRRVQRPRCTGLALVTRLFFGGSLLTIALYILLCVLENSGLYLYFGGMISQQLREYIRPLIPLLLGIGAVLLIAKWVRPWVTACLSVLLAAALFFLFVMLAFAETTYRYTEATATVGNHEVVFLEKGYLFFGGDGDVYERTSTHILRKLGDYPADDYTFPVYNGNCSFDWHEDGLVLHYGETEWEFHYGKKRS